MIQVLSILAIVLLAGLVMPVAVRSMRRRRGGADLGGAFLSLEAVVRPAAAHAIEARQGMPKGSPESGEPPTLGSGPDLHDPRPGSTSAA